TRARFGDDREAAARAVRVKSPAAATWLGALALIPALTMALALSTGCARPRANATSATSAASATPAGAVAPRTKAAPLDPERLYVVLVNGGGNRAGNYQSHVVHLRALLEVLAEAGVPRERITVFASDGEEPEADLAPRELLPEGKGWLLEGTSLEGPLGRPMQYVSTSIEGQTLRAATPEAVRAWFAREGKELRPGD